ncbi:DUF1294 domain-containing protein [Alkalicoccobacillus murimartini]|uniref:Uncharacterized membrane protein YsdA (DUF1294 family) n=1 Tax=Alkalicoccobacillus murimartini TaxID=171685 RepID=A0ABT9YK95_9BACI|nr:DUF1294 domain-containing protein [Alkalicoccobacillus murimartini]MDQ0208074.1 uncharacterized membrane protein YsdA (DUF1294 family) [Alkalicoccobacillus murimartini]
MDDNLGVLLGVYLTILTIVGFMTMYRDKQLAIKQKRRTPEKTLMLIALLGGSLGSLAGMRMFRHKTKHAKFSVGLPVLLILHISILLFILLPIQA